MTANEADFFPLIEAVEDHRDEVATWLPLVDGLIDGRRLIDPAEAAGMKALLTILEDALISRDPAALQQAEAAYHANRFFSDGPVLFSAGEVLATPAAAALGVDLAAYFKRHARGDWGDVDASDKAANDLALKTGGELLSRYDTPAGSIYVYTEPDRSATTIMLRSEY